MPDKLQEQALLTASPQNPPAGQVSNFFFQFLENIMRITVVL